MKHLKIFVLAAVVVLVGAAGFSTAQASDGCPNPVLTATPSANRPPESVGFSVDDSAFIECYIQSNHLNRQSVVEDYGFMFDDGTSESSGSSETTHYYGPVDRQYNPSVEVTINAEGVDPLDVGYHTHTGRTKLILAPANMTVYKEEIEFLSGNPPYKSDDTSPKNFSAAFNWRGASSGRGEILLVRAADNFAIQSSGMLALTKYFEQLDGNPLASHAVSETKTVAFDLHSAGPGTYKVCARGESISGAEASQTSGFNPPVCTDSFAVENVYPAVDLKADGQDAQVVKFGNKVIKNEALRKQVGESAKLTWTSAAVERLFSTTDPANPSGGADGWGDGASQFLQMSDPGVSVTFTKPGSYKLGITGNPTDEVYLEVAEPDRPDLIITSHGPNPSSPTANQVIFMRATVKNQGDAAAGTFGVIFEVKEPSGRTAVNSGSISSLAPGESKVISQSIDIKEEGLHTYEVRADFNNNVTESNEGNNTASGSFDAVNPEPPPQQENKTLSVILNVSPRLGSAPLNGVDVGAGVSGTATGPMEYIFYCDRPDGGVNVTSPWDARFYNQNIESLGVSDLCDYPSAGGYTVKVIVLRDGLAAENRQTVTVTSPEAPPPPQQPPQPQEGPQQGPQGPNPACSDGIDNDGDGFADYPADVGCSSPDDNDETVRFLRREIRER